MPISYTVLTNSAPHHPGTLAAPTHDPVFIVSGLVPGEIYHFGLAASLGPGRASSTLPIGVIGGGLLYVWSIIVTCFYGIMISKQFVFFVFFFKKSMYFYVFLVLFHIFSYSKIWYPVQRRKLCAQSKANDWVN